MENTDFFSQGKLLLSGEYLVLDGAKALALPTKMGQHLNIDENQSDFLKWISEGSDGRIWFQQKFLFQNGTITPVYELESKDEKKTQKRLLQLFRLILSKKPEAGLKGFRFHSKLDFPRNWGLGSSSTLIQNLSNWTGVDPYFLLEESFGGSGYDIACANAKKPIFFQRKGEINVEKTNFNPAFADLLFFVHLNQKQNSREAIKNYRKQNPDSKTQAITEISEISEKLTLCKDLAEFENLLDRHEAILAKILNQTPVKERLFPDFLGSVKSLGAWGGDFVLATGNNKGYFQARGYDTVLGFGELFGF